MFIHPRCTGGDVRAIGVDALNRRLEAMNGVTKEGDVPIEELQEKDVGVGVTVQDR